MSEPVQKKLSFETESKPKIRLTGSGADDAPFLRPKVRTRIRRSRRSLLAHLVLGAQLAGALLLTLGSTWAVLSRVMGSERLKVLHLEVRGTRYLSQREVRDLLGPLLGENILTLDIDEAKSRLSSSPWVASATVRRALPNALEVEIEERRPVALAEMDRLYLMAGDGTLIEPYGPRTAEFDLPVVRGLRGLPAEARRLHAEQAGALLSDLGEVGAEISEVTVTGGGDLRAVLRRSGIVLRLGSPPYRGRVDMFLSLREELLARTPDAVYFDLRFRDRILAKLPAAFTPGPGFRAEPR